MRYLIRRIASLSDVRELVAIHNEVWKHSTGIIDLLAGASDCYLAVSSETGRVAGYAFVERDPARGHLELNDIAVDPAVRGHGCGAQLLQAIMEEHDRIKLCVRADNAAAVGLYERFGFRQEAVFENYYEIGVDALRLIWQREG